MRFKDDAIRIKIKTKDSKGNIIDNFKFKSYVEKSDISFKVEQQDIRFTPIGMAAKGINTQLTYTMDLVFDLFAEDRKEAILNYRDLHKLIDSLKPSYVEDGKTYEPDANNSLGNISIDFPGFPKILNTSNELPIRLTTFTYSINKDMGYIQVPYDNVTEEQEKLFLIPNGMRLVPISFKISLAGQILSKLEDMAKINQIPNLGTAPVPPPPKGSVSGASGNDSADKWNNLSPEDKKDLIKKFNDATDTSGRFPVKEMNDNLINVIRDHLGKLAVAQTAIATIDKNPGGYSDAAAERRRQEHDMELAKENLKKLMSPAQ